MMKKRWMCLLAVVAAFGALACCMVPVSYQGRIGQDAQEAVLIHDGNREELVLRINYRIQGKKMPDTFVWVITTPKEPDAYAVADPLLFKDMFDLAQALVDPVTKSLGRSNMTDSLQKTGVELGKRVQVGPYDIQPVRGVGPHALAGLNAWLKANGFPTEAPDHMTYFVENKFTFLCVKVTAQDKTRSVESKGMLPPLHLSFETPVPYYPLRFSSRQGVFDVNLHLLTRSKLDYQKSGPTLTKINWSSKTYKPNVPLPEKRMPATLKNVFSKSAWKEDVKTWHYNNIRCSRVNSKHPISDWKEDVFLSTQ